MTSSIKAVAVVLEICSEIDGILLAGGVADAGASETLDQTRSQVVPRLESADQLAAALPIDVSLGQLSLFEMTTAGHSLIHTCKTSAEQLPDLAPRFEAFWTRWTDAARAHPTVREALALR